jgi:hypothetical protein
MSNFPSRYRRRNPLPAEPAPARTLEDVRREIEALAAPMQRDGGAADEWRTLYTELVNITTGRRLSWVVTSTTASGNTFRWVFPSVRITTE